MKTSALLLDDSGKRIEDWCAYFSAAPHPDHPEDAARASVVHSFLIEGHLEDFHETPLAEFVQVIEHPFEIDAVECLYLNRDSIYDAGMIQSLSRFTRTADAVPVALVPVLPAELAGAGLMLDRKMLNAFKRGYPIWRRGALSCSPGRGKRGGSSASKLLRQAILTWGIESEIAVRQLLYRARRERKMGKDSDLKVRSITKEVVQYFLGYDSLNQSVDFSVPSQNIARVNLAEFKLNSVQHETRKRRRPKRRLNTESFKTTPHLDFSKRRSSQLERDVKFFEIAHPDCHFDAFALAEWNVKILLILRLFYTITTKLDDLRPVYREILISARTFDIREIIAQGFSDTFIDDLKGGRQSGVRRIEAWVSNLTLRNVSELALIPFFADMDPRLIGAQLHPSALKNQDAIFETARWLGTLYRHNKNYLTTSQAQKYLYLLDCKDGSDYDKTNFSEQKELHVSLKTITSFITPLGLLRLEEAARSTVVDGVTRTIYTIDPDYECIRKRQTLLRASSWATDLHDSDSGFGANAIPFPVFVPAGKLLVPGDYMETWFGNSDDFEKGLPKRFRESLDA